MRLVPTHHCKPGMTISKPIFSKTGQVLVNSRTPLTDRTIERLSSMGYEYLYIEDPNTQDIYIEDCIKMETRIALRMAVERVLDTVINNPQALLRGSISLSNLCFDAILMTIGDLRKPTNEPIMLVNVNAPGDNKLHDHFVQNAINVCVYATKIGISEGYSTNELLAFSLGALLHDVGNMWVSQDILRKPAALTAVEFNEVKKHCENGYEMLKNSGLPVNAALCALLHHERIDGSGYPFGLKDGEIHPYARWIGLIDAYDAMTNPRPYRTAILPHEAMEILYAQAGTRFDKEKVETFRNKVAIFPVGVSVLLNTGERGIVSKVDPHCIHRPTIRILGSASGETLKDPYEIDLSQRLNIMIERIGEVG